jgi:Uma2 family endonuclease
MPPSRVIFFLHYAFTFAEKPCRAYISDMKVRVKTDSAYYYPDVVGTCATRDIAADAPAYYLEAPNLIVEVLSDSTTRTDRREKLVAYQQLESLVEYLLVDQYKREVEVYRRTPQGWSRDIYSAGETVALKSVDLALPMDLIYEDSGVN